MNHGSAVRHYGLFFEGSGKYAVSEQFVQETAQIAIDRISRFTGGIALGKPVSVRLNPERATVTPATLTFSAAEPFNIVVTGRKLKSASLQHEGSYPRGMYLPEGVGKSPTNDIFISADPHLGESLTPDCLAVTMQHEIAHSFELGHCISRACIMYDDKTLSEQKIFSGLDDPFCGQHAEELVLNGRKALEETL